MTDKERERAAFLAALERDRYDRAARLAFTDWLLEQGEDAAAEDMRRTTTSEWEEADRWMHAQADAAGFHVYEGYGAGYLYDESGEWTGEYDEDVHKERPVTYEDLIDAGHDYLATGDYFIQIGRDTLRDNMDPELYWRYWSIITGVEPPPLTEEEARWYKHRPAPFSCSC